MTIEIPTPAELAVDFRAWLAEHHDELAHLRELQVDVDERVENLKELQALLFDAGWARYGWPEDFAGLGGNILHRAVVYEELAAAGYPPRFVYEHLEVLLPTLVKFGEPELMGELVPLLLRGEDLWSQGFSEPGAGSDLAALRTKAVPADDGGWVIDGHKIWTSWAKWADRCLVIARTGPTESRHRGLSAFIVDLDQPGVDVVPIVQTNGSPELAEVFFDEVHVDSTRLLGDVDGGWGVAMYILSCERGSFAWQRNTYVRQRLEGVAPRATDPTDHERLGNSLADLFATRVRSWSTMRQLKAGGVPGPEAAVNKVLISDGEQYLFETVDRIHPSGLMWAQGPDDTVLQEEMLFAHVISIYGGTRQIQDTVIFRHLVGDRSKIGDDPWLEAAVAALTGSDGPAAGLVGLGYDDVLTDLDDPDSRLAVAAVFEAQGRAACSSPALAGLMAAGLGTDATLALATEGLPGDLTRIVVDAAAVDASSVVVSTEAGWVIADGRALRWEPETHFLQDGRLRCATTDLSDAAEFDAERAESAVALARLAVSFEALGCADAMFEVAVEHAENREQFGSPLAANQAVQFMLAEAHIARTALREVCIATRDAPGSQAAALTKIIAGRSGRRVGKETLQVFGAIGFTEEHPHHTWFHRVLAIDAMLGRSAALAHELGASMVATGVVPVGLTLEQLPEATA